MEDFKDLRVWQRAHDLTLDVYRCSREFPKEELYGVTSEMRRAAASIGANIAEGCGRRSDPEMKRFVQIARGSANELEYICFWPETCDCWASQTTKFWKQECLKFSGWLTALTQRLESPALARS